MFFSCSCRQSSSDVPLLGLDPPFVALMEPRNTRNARKGPYERWERGTAETSNVQRSTLNARLDRGDGRVGGPADRCRGMAPGQRLDAPSSVLLPAFLLKVLRLKRRPMRGEQSMISAWPPAHSAVGFSPWHNCAANLSRQSPTELDDRRSPFFTTLGRLIHVV